MNQGNPERFGNPVPRDITSAERTTCEHCGKQVIPLIPHPCVGPVSPVRPPTFADDRGIVGALVDLQAVGHGSPVRDPAPPDWKDTARVLFDALCNARHSSNCATVQHHDCDCGIAAAHRAWDATAELQNAYDLENE